MSTMSHCDAVVRDVSQLIEAAHTQGEVVKHARALLEINPRSAFAMLELVYFDWDATKDRVPAWLKLVGEAPPLLWALGKKYSDLKRYDEAEGYLRRFIQQSPDRRGLRAARRQLQGGRRSEALEGDARRVPGQGRRPRTGPCPGSGEDRRRLHGAPAVGGGAAVRRGGGGDLGPVGDDAAPRVATRG